MDPLLLFMEDVTVANLRSANTTDNVFGLGCAGGRNAEDVKLCGFSHGLKNDLRIIESSFFELFIPPTGRLKAGEAY